MDTLSVLQTKRAQDAMNEVPKISDAVKNYFTMRLAEGFTDAVTLQKMAKVLLNAINTFVLLPPPQWGLQYPQREEQSGESRMAQVGEYTLFFALWSMVKKTPEAKPTKMLGKSFLCQVWSEIKEVALANGSSSEETELMQTFIDGFEVELHAEGTDSEESLVWTPNFNATLAKRRQNRQEQAKARAARSVGDNEMQEMIKRLVQEANADTEGESSVSGSVS
mmetsp:Transcript_151680/g.265034  ORF Transcript_151680/g.265034 Transcript_151680/m.265034 type:complete len:222 (-) Transcript_151680:789-1454(-)